MTNLSSTSDDRPWITRIHDARGLLSDCALDLNSIARALGRVGMDKIAREIAALADDVNQAANEIMSAATAELNDSVRQAEQGTANILLTALAFANRSASKAVEERPANGSSENVET